jgi:Helix-hairpin-helix motif
MPYSHPQLRALLVLAALFLAGLGVREWRAGFPEAALRLERFDQEPGQASPPPPPESSDADRAPTEGAPLPTIGSADGAKTTPRAPPPEGADPRPLDLNRATVAELSRLPGVGPGLARRILEDRDRRGPFNSPEALGRIVGLGPKKLAALRELVTVGE